ADRVVQKYQTSTCEQLWQERAAGQGKPKPEMEERLVKLLREDAQLRTEFFNRVAAPIVNKMVECGMIPAAPPGRCTRSGANDTRDLSCRGRLSPRTPRRTKVQFRRSEARRILFPPPSAPTREAGEQ